MRPTGGGRGVGHISSTFTSLAIFYLYVKVFAYLYGVALDGTLIFALRRYPTYSMAAGKPHVPVR